MGEIAGTMACRLPVTLVSGLRKWLAIRIFALAAKMLPIQPLDYCALVWGGPG